MQATINNLKRSALGMLLALVLVAPSAFAKKDLFASDPASKTAGQTQQLIAPPVATEDKTAAPKAEQEPSAAIATTTETEKPSYLSSQFKRLQLNIVQTKDKLFSKSSKSPTTDPQPLTTTTPITAQADASSNEASAGISSTDAIQRAQKIAEGKVMNVKKYQEGDKSLYVVKLLQKNGRMKTVTLDAITGQEAEASAQPTE